LAAMTVSPYISVVQEVVVLMQLVHEENLLLPAVAGALITTVVFAL
jgi:hypothetical protein